MRPKFSRGFKDIITKTAKFKEFPGLENKFQNSRGFKEIKDTWEPCIIIEANQDTLCHERKFHFGASYYKISMVD